MSVSSGMVRFLGNTTQRRTEHLWLTKERVEAKRQTELTAKSTVVQA